MFVRESLPRASLGAPSGRYKFGAALAPYPVEHAGDEDQPLTPARFALQACGCNGEPGWDFRIDRLAAERCANDAVAAVACRPKLGRGW